MRKRVLGELERRGRGQLIERATVGTCEVEKKKINEEIFINKIIIKNII